MKPVQTILTATAVAGTLDILSAFVFSTTASPPQVLRYVATGPFGDGMADAGAGGALLGLLVHYGIMTIMVTVFVLASRRWPALTASPILSGIAYGLLLYGVMYWIVLPLRFPALFPITQPIRVAKALFSHLILVGIPIAVIARRGLHGREQPAAGSA
jgi:hypothetical protein